MTSILHTAPRVPLPAPPDRPAPPRAVRLARWVGRRARGVADILDRAGAPQATPWTFTADPTQGIRHRTDGQGCRLWYLGEDYRRAYADAIPPTEPCDPDRPCPHDTFATEAEIHRVTRSDQDPTVVGFMAHLRIGCIQCGEPMRWSGLPAGLSPHHPTCSIDETELVAPLRPASSDPDFGMGIPGYAVRFRTTGE